MGGSWDINYGENGAYNGADIFLCIPAGPEEITFTYDPFTHLIATSPVASGFSSECLPLVVLAGTFQDELACSGEWIPDCANSQLIYNPNSGLFEGDLSIPAGCYEYKVVLENSWQNNYGKEGIFNGENYELYIPPDPESTHFTYDPISHVVTSSPYGNSPQEVTSVTLEGSSLQNELIRNDDSGFWEGSFTLTPGCYTYRVRETIGCNVNYYGENGEYWPEIQLYVPTEAEITFSYDPQTHLVSSTPYSGNPQEVTSVTLEGSSLQNELILNANSGFWEGSFTLSEGCYTYRVKETIGCNVNYYGENGEYWPEIQLYVPTEAEITFSYDPQTHLITSTPYSGNPQEATSVSIEGSSFQNELILNADSGFWEGSFTLPAGCYFYWVKESVGCNEFLYGENGQIIQLYVPIEGEITFRYDPETHTMTSTPYSGVPQEVTSISLFGDLQNELGCPDDNDPECNGPALVFNSESGTWEGTFNLPSNCYTYLIKATSACSVQYYGENGYEWSPIQLYIPAAGEITFSYDPQTHIVTSTPYYPVPEEVTAVSLVGSFQTELGCDSDEDLECDKPALALNPVSGLWEGSFTLPAGCYSYRVKERFGCETSLYGEYNWPPIELYVPTEAEITFSYDPQTHTISSTPYAGVPQEITKVSLVGSLQDELGCENEGDTACDKPALMYNNVSGLWEGSFTLPAGCYGYMVKETFGCNEGILFGENGQESGESIQLYVPSDGEVTFSYDPQTHIISSTPYGDVPQEMTRVYLLGTLQDELGCAFPGEDDCENAALELNPASGLWEGSFILPTGCYTYWLKEATPCGVEYYYGETGGEIQLFVPTDAEITFSYDPQTHMVSSTPYSGVPEEVTSVTLYGSLQDELGCNSEYDQECNNSALIFNPGLVVWEGSFTFSAGCYSYWVKETFGCDSILYGENGSAWNDEIQLYIPEDGEISFTYDPETHVITSNPYSGIPQEVTAVSLTDLPDEVVCPGANECDEPALLFNSDSGIWEGSLTLPAGCHSYRVKETSVCSVSFYGENGNDWPQIMLYVPTESEISFRYDPETHLMTTSPYSGVPEEVTSVSLNGNFSDTVSYLVLTKNEISGNWEGKFELPAGCYTYWVEETVACWNSYHYGENGVGSSSGGKVIQLYIPESGEVSFIYDPQTHIMTSTPYSGAPQDVSKVSITIYPNELDLNLNPDSGEWEGSVELAAGCYSYEARETLGCEETSYGGNLFYLPLSGEITFRYNPETHITNTTPYSGVPEEVTNVNLIGYLDGEYGSIPLSKNDVSGKWEGTYMAPAGCYAYRVEETISCAYNYTYGEDGIENGDYIQLNIPLAGEISFTYDPETHLITSTPYSGAPQEVTKVFLYGSFQEELGCDNVSVYECEKSTLIYNPGSVEWTGSFTLPAGCYYYWIREIVGCNIESDYGKDGVKDGNYIDLYVPTEGEVTFSYDPQTHVITSSPGGIPQDVTAVSLFGSLQSEVGCSYDSDPWCDAAALGFNAESGMWEGSFTLPAGCYTYRVKETFGCETKTYYGKDGTKNSDDIWLNVPVESEITFNYDPQTHIITSTPYSDNSTIVECPSDIFADNSPELCGAMVNYPEMVANFDCGGDVSSVTQTAGLPSGSEFPIGTTTNTYDLVKTTGEVIICSFDVIVTDTEAPVIADLQENYEPLWPPNHKMIPVYLDYVAWDNCSIAGSEITITSNEPENTGKGDKAPDWEIVDEHNIMLRAERDAKGTGREYYITIKVTDDSGNFSEQQVTIAVPRDNSKRAEEDLQDVTSIDEYILYPNAADDVIRIKGPENFSNFRYLIFDMLGEMRRQGTSTNDQIEVSTLPSGTYTVKFETVKGYTFKRFIKK